MRTHWFRVSMGMLSGCTEEVSKPKRSVGSSHLMDSHLLLN